MNEWIHEYRMMTREQIWNVRWVFILNGAVVPSEAVSFIFFSMTDLYYLPFLAWFRFAPLRALVLRLVCCPSPIFSWKPRAFSFDETGIEPMHIPPATQTQTGNSRSGTGRWSLCSWPGKKPAKTYSTILSGGRLEIRVYLRRGP